MRRVCQFGIVATGSLACFAEIAHADITANDVWESHQAYYAATGATVTGTVHVAGNRTEISDAAVSYDLPFNAGSLLITLPPLHMIENADGTVTFDSPSMFTVTASASMNNRPVSATIDINHDSLTGTASGTPDDITFIHQAGAFTVNLRDLQLPEDGIDFALTAQGEGYEITSRVTLGELITTQSTSKVLPRTVNYSYETTGGIAGASTATYGEAQTTATLSLVAAGANLFDLSPAFRDGMAITVETIATGNTSEVLSMLDGVVISKQKTGVSSSVANISLNANGLNVDLNAHDFLVSLNQPNILPFPIDFEVASIAGGYNLPVLASETPQEFGFDLGVEGLEFGSDLWTLFDPKEKLPRELVSLDLELDGTAINSVDLFNIRELEAAFSQQNFPISLETLSLGDLWLDILGSTLKGNGAFNFDNSDRETFGGFPKPVGDAFLAVTGANTLLDRLLSTGVISQSEASAARLAMGLFARATGNDSFETSVNFAESGELSVNGQRIR